MENILEKKLNPSLKIINKLINSMQSSSDLSDESKRDIVKRLTNLYGIESEALREGIKNDVQSIVKNLQPRRPNKKIEQSRKKIEEKDKKIAEKVFTENKKIV